MAVLAGCLFLMLGSPALAAGTSYYVNCAAASDGNGSSTSPWNNLTTVNSKTFAPGDSLLFNRGTTCVGSFVFSSSGTSANRITIGAYGTGALPVIDGTGQNRAVKLLDTSYVTMQDLEVKNSRVWGVLLTTDHDAPAVGITLKNLVVHHVTGGSYVEMGAKWTGLVVFAPGMIVEPDMTKGSGVYTRKSYFDTVLVDNVQAYDTTLWAGIFVWGVQVDQDFQWSKDSKNQAIQSRNITIQNSAVHDTYGDGIAIYMSHEGTIQSSVVYRSGMEPPPEDIGSPVGLWWWTAENMVGQLNESYNNHSPSVDGGGYDIDYGSTNSTMQYNYGHDNGAYCISVFGYHGATTTNIVRYNVCAGDGTVHTYLKKKPSGGLTTEILPGQSELYLCTWGGGTLADTWIYNNTFYVNSTGDPSATGLFDVCPGGGDSETNGVFRNNLVVSTIPNVLGDLATANARVRDYNLYYYTGGTFTDPNPEAHGIYNQNPLVNSLGYHGIGRPTTQWTLQSGSPAINRGTNACTGLTGCSVGTRDFFGNSIPLGGAFDIGAHEAG
ncbi:MAG TPA: choice-of-anchor Q domain-containing protein [Gaiellaceae bacterium]